MSGFIPNSFQHPNLYVDKYMSFLTNNELRVLVYMMRRIFGFHKHQDRIAISQITEGIVTKQGERLDYGAGLSKPACIKAIEGLSRFGLVVEVADNDPKAREGKCYALQLEESQVDFDGLVQRKGKTKEVETARTQKARKAKSEVNGIDPVAQKSGKSDLPHEVNETYRYRSMPFTNKVSVENQLEIQTSVSCEQITDSLEGEQQKQVVYAQESLLNDSPLGKDVSVIRTSSYSAPVAPRAPAKSKQPNPNTKPILDAYFALLTYKPTNAGKEAKAAKALADDGYTPEQVTAAYRRMKAEAFWQLKHLSLAKVHENIGALLPALSPPGNGQRASSRDGYTFLNV